MTDPTTPTRHKPDCEMLLPSNWPIDHKYDCGAAKPTPSVDYPLVEMGEPPPKAWTPTPPAPTQIGLCACGEASLTQDHLMECLLRKQPITADELKDGIAHLKRMAAEQEKALGFPPDPQSGAALPEDAPSDPAVLRTRLEQFPDPLGAAITLIRSHEVTLTTQAEALDVKDAEIRDCDILADAHRTLIDALRAENARLVEELASWKELVQHKCGVVRGMVRFYKLAREENAAQAEQIKRMREALEFYADKGHYISDYGHTDCASRVGEDIGARAQEALKEDSK